MPRAFDLSRGDARPSLADEQDWESLPPRRRRTPYEADALRVQMLRGGFPVPGLTPKENEHIFSSLLQRRRLTRVLALAELDEAGYQAAVQQARRQRASMRRARRAPSV